METLSVIIEGSRMGSLNCENGKLSFKYDVAWLADGNSYPLSTSMPLSTAVHLHKIVDAFLWGLLPDNRLVLESLAKKFHVSANNAFKLIKHVGADCAGAMQFISPEKESCYLDPQTAEDVQWLSTAELDEHIRDTIQHSGAGIPTNSEGQFSLAGAQLKTALYQRPKSDQWGIPKGSTPTTHILKPAPKEFAGFAENEHYCLQLAKALGMEVADSYVEEIAELPVIVVKRYDRFFDEGLYSRIHQEDFCQALAVHPSKKYQNESGPSVKDLAEVIWDYSSYAQADIKRFADALIFNYLIAGGDAHAKNYSLILSYGFCGLAPLYDIASSLPYPGSISPHKMTLAMKIGSEYKLKKIEVRHWKACAKELRLSPDYLTNRLHELIQLIPSAANKTAALLHSEGLDNPVIDILSEAIEARALSLQSTLS